MLSAALLLRQAALAHPERIVIVDHGSGETWSARDLDARARAVAGGLGQRDIGPGDRVGLWCDSGADFAAAWFGILYAGGVVVPYPVTSVEPELEARQTLTRARALLVDRRDRTGLAAISLSDLAGGRRVDGPVPRGGDDEAMILFTSGTTDEARGAVISHGALLVHTQGLVHHTLGLTPADRILGVLPLTHSFGLRMVLLCGLYAGAELHLFPRFDAGRSLQAMIDHDLTWVPGVPTMFARWARVPGEARPPHLRWCLSAGAPLPDSVQAAASARLGAEVRQGYGMTEATFSTLDAPGDGAPGLGSVGRPVWGVELRLADDGEICVRGPNMMAGYLDDPAATGQTVRDGWVHSGDLGAFDDAGRLVVVDRKKDLILRGGHNVHPANVEAVLTGHPGVLEAAVVGRPDPDLGEEVVAAVVPTSPGAISAEALLAWLDGRLAHTHRPREIIVVDHLPRTASGKIMRRAVRALLGASRPGED